MHEPRDDFKAFKQTSDGARSWPDCRPPPHRAARPSSPRCRRRSPSDDQWSRVLDVNLTSVFRLSREAIKGMMKRRSGRIINITSIVGVTGNAGQANYAASKAGLIGLSKSLAAEVATRGITVNCIAPGFIESPMTSVLNDKQREKILGEIPQGKIGSPKDIAAGVVFLASEEAGYLTGQTLHINGGMTMV